MGLVLYVGVPLVVIARGINLITILVGVALVIVGTMLLTTRYGIQVDPFHKTYTEYTWLLGRKIGKPVSFQFIEKFYINPVTDQAEFMSRAGIRYDLRKHVFKAFMKLDDGTKLYIGTGRTEDKLQKKVDNYQLQLQSIYQPF